MKMIFDGKNGMKVTFTQTDKSAADLVIYNLAEYGKHMSDPDIDALSDALQKACTEIGMLEAEDAPKDEDEDHGNS
jgi:hypothetical protein